MLPLPPAGWEEGLHWWHKFPQLVVLTTCLPGCARAGETEVSDTERAVTRGRYAAGRRLYRNAPRSICCFYLLYFPLFFKN